MELRSASNAQTLEGFFDIPGTKAGGETFGETSAEPEKTIDIERMSVYDIFWRTVDIYDLYKYLYIKIYITNVKMYPSYQRTYGILFPG